MGGGEEGDDPSSKKVVILCYIVIGVDITLSLAWILFDKGRLVGQRTYFNVRVWIEGE